MKQLWCQAKGEELLQVRLISSTRSQDGTSVQNVNEATLMPNKRRRIASS